MIKNLITSAALFAVAIIGRSAAEASSPVAPSDVLRQSLDDRTKLASKLTGDIENYVRMKTPFHSFSSDDGPLYSRLCSPEQQSYELRYYLYLADQFLEPEDAREADNKVRLTLKTVFDNAPSLEVPGKDVFDSSEQLHRYMTSVAQYDQYYILRSISASSTISDNLGADQQLWSALEFLMTERQCQAMSVQEGIVSGLVGSLGWDSDKFSTDDLMALFLVVQHAVYNPDLQAAALPEFRALVDQGRMDPARYAYLEDRISLNQKGFQIYGSQLAGCGLKPLIDPETVNDRRAEMGMETIESYLSWVPNCASKRND